MQEPAVNVIAIIKSDGEKYVFMYEDHQVSRVLQTIGRFAGNPALSFDWHDALIVSNKVRDREKADDY